MDIDNLAIDSGSAIYYDDSFRAVLEDHMTFLRVHQTTTVITIDPNIADVWTGDLFGLLTTLRIPAFLHWIIMRMNMMMSPQDNDSSLRSLLVPSSRTIDVLKNIQKTKAKIN